MSTSRIRLAVAALAVSSVALLSGCGGTTSADMGTAVMEPGVVAPAPGAVAAEAPMDGSAAIPTQSADRSVIRSASAFLGVDDLAASRTELARIVAAEDGTVISEYAKSGTATPQPPVYYGYEESYMPPAYEFEQYVDVTFTVPSANYDSTIEKVRGLGEVISVNQSATDVTMQVVDTDARIDAARASVDRIEALLGEAATLDEMLRLEQELTIRQANLDSLLAQQASLASQVEQSTITVRMVPNALLEDAGAIGYGEPSLGDRVVTALGDAWTGFVVFLAYTSPLWVLAGLVVLIVVLIVRRQSRRKKELLSANAGDVPVG